MVERTINRTIQLAEVWPPDKVRNMGIYWVASKGSGKSRGMGRWVAKQDCLRGVPQVIFDPAGGTIDNLLDSLSRLPLEHQCAIWPRVIYVNMGDREAVMPFPLYYRLSSQESLFQTSQRYLDVVRMLDPHLQSASVEGWNALWQCGTNAGMALAAMGGQIVDASTLLGQPKRFKSCLQSALAAYPESQPAVDWLLRELPGLKPELRSRRMAAFQQKIGLFSYDEPTQAMVGASVPGLDWQRVIDQGQTVLLDFRHVLDAEHRRFLLMWTLFYFLDFIKHRGAGRHRSIGCIIDEVSVLTNMDIQSGLNLFALAIDELLNVWARQGQVWVTISHQEVWQVSERLFKTLMGCGTRIMGRTSDATAAIALARELMPADPRRVKRYEPIYDGERQIIDYRPTEYSLDEQHYLASQLYKDLSTFRFLVKAVSGEGGHDTPLRPLNLTGLEPGVWPDDEKVAKIRQLLHRRTAVPVATILKEIRDRRGRWLGEAGEMNEPSGSDIVQDDACFDGFKVE